MECEIGLMPGDRHLEFLDEQALAADGGKRAIQNPVALRGKRYQLDGDIRMRSAQQRGNMLGLPQRQRALASCNAQRRPGAHWDSGSGG